MQPTLNHDDWILIRKFNKEEDAIKSVGCVVFADWKGRRLVKRFAKLLEADNSFKDVFCWLESDNGAGERKFYDSNIFGYVDCSALKGKVVAVVFPPSRFRIFD